MGLMLVGVYVCVRAPVGRWMAKVVGCSKTGPWPDITDAYGWRTRMIYISMETIRVHVLCIASPFFRACLHSHPNRSQLAHVWPSWPSPETDAIKKEKLLKHSEGKTDAWDVWLMLLYTSSAVVNGPIRLIQFRVCERSMLAGDIGMKVHPAQ